MSAHAYSPDPIASRPHRITLAQDVTHAHLWNPSCSCGWRTHGYVKLVVANLLAERHVERAQGAQGTIRGAG